jgi:hypothetical protein
MSIKKTKEIRENKREKLSPLLKLKDYVIFNRHKRGIHLVIFKKKNLGNCSVLSLIFLD